MLYALFIVLLDGPANDLGLAYVFLFCMKARHLAVLLEGAEAPILRFFFLHLLSTGDHAA